MGTYYQCQIQKKIGPRLLHYWGPSQCPTITITLKCCLEIKVCYDSIVIGKKSLLRFKKKNQHLGWRLPRIWGPRLQSAKPIGKSDTAYYIVLLKVRAWFPLVEMHTQYNIMWYMNEALDNNTWVYTDSHIYWIN
jgi:hypothetical protein